MNNTTTDTDNSGFVIVYGVIALIGALMGCIAGAVVVWVIR